MDDWSDDFPASGPDIALIEATLEHAPIGIAHIRADGQFSFVNHYLCEITGYTRAELILHRFHDIVHPSDLLATRGSVVRDELLAGTVLTYTREVRFVRKDRSWVWVRLHVKLAPGGADDAPLLAVIEDISARQRAQRRLAAQTSVSKILLDAPHFSDASPSLLETIGTHLDCACGLMWCIDQEAGVLRYTYGWHDASVQASQLDALHASPAVAKGDHLPGLVWERAATMCGDSEALVADAARSAVLLACGARSAFAFPIRSAHTFFGVVEFFSAQPPCDDDDLVALLDGLGTQMGEYIERRRAEIAVAARDATLRYQAHLLNTVDQAVIGTDLRGIITYWNRYAEVLYGWSASEALGQSIALIPTSLPPEEYAQVLERILRGETWSGELVMRRRDGTTFWASVVDTPVVDVEGVVVGIVGTSFDITERKRAEERLLFLDTLSTGLNDSLAVHETLDVLAGLVVPRVADWCIVDHVDDGRLTRIAAFHRDPARTEELWDYDLWFGASPTSIPREHRVLRQGDALDGDGTLGSGSVVVIPLSARGHSLGALAFGLPKAEHAAADLELFDEIGRRTALALDNALLYEETQRAVRARDEFLSVAAHELKTPLTIMVGYTQMIERRLARTLHVGERDLIGLRTVAAQAERVTRLMTLLLDVSRMETGQFTLDYAPVDLCALGQQVLEAIALSVRNAENPVRLSCECRQPSVMVQGDLLRLEQVVYNLLQNAVKYSPQGGPVTLTVEGRETGAVMSVRDRGIGIPAAALPHLFNRFYRVRSDASKAIGGVGIGLYVVREIVEQHGGSVDVESVEGQGTTFTVFLPYTPPAS